MKNSHRGCSVKKGALTNYPILTGKYLCWNLFLKRVPNTGVFLQILQTFLRLYYIRSFMAVNNLSFEEDFAIYKCVLKSNKNNMKIFNQIESSNTP